MRFWGKSHQRFQGGKYEVLHQTLHDCGFACIGNYL